VKNIYAYRDQHVTTNTKPITITVLIITVNIKVQTRQKVKTCMMTILDDNEDAEMAGEKEAGKGKVTTCRTCTLFHCLCCCQTRNQIGNSGSRDNASDQPWSWAHAPIQCLS